MNIEYKKDKNKYYKDNSPITLTKLKKELKNYQLKKLNENGFCNVRVETRPKEKRKKETPEEKAIRLDNAIYNKNINNYKIDYCTYKKGSFSQTRKELWRKNSRYGYFNFVCYVDNLDDSDIKDIIIADVKNQIQLAKSAKAPVSDDDI